MLFRSKNYAPLWQLVQATNILANMVGTIEYHRFLIPRKRSNMSLVTLKTIFLSLCENGYVSTMMNLYTHDLLRSHIALDVNEKSLKCFSNPSFNANLSNRNFASMF